MSNDKPFIQQFHSTVQVELLNETTINSNKLALALDTASLEHYYRNAYHLNKLFATYAYKLLHLRVTSFGQYDFTLAKIDASQLQVG